MARLEGRFAEILGKAPRPGQLRFAEAYIAMAEIDYRPGAPGDGMGSINLSEDELADEDVLIDEAVRYAIKFRGEEDGATFRIGVSNYRTNRAFVMTVEAARLLAGASDEWAVKLLNMALEEVARTKRKSE